MTSEPVFDPTGDLPGFLRGFPGGLTGNWVLICLLDSAPPNPESPTVKDAMRDFKAEIEWTEAGLLIPGVRMEDLLEADRLFNGFDQIVVFSQKPENTPPLEMRFTTDTTLGDLALSELSIYLEKHGAIAAAADGAGLVSIKRP